MSDTAKAVVILVTVPDRGTGEGLARELLRARLVACANVLPELRSLYWWEGEIEESPEALVILKARADDVPKIASRIRELHPYEVPEVIATEVVDGLAEYLDWVFTETERSEG